MRVLAFQFLRRVPVLSRARLFSRSFSSDAFQNIERADLYPLQDNSHILPKNLPTLPSELSAPGTTECKRMWVSAISSCLLRPSSWHAYESTVTYPYDELTGNPQRNIYLSREDPYRRGFFWTGLTVNAYMIVDDGKAYLGGLRKKREVNNFVNDILVGNRLFDHPPEGQQTRTLPPLEKDITILEKGYFPPNELNRAPFHVTRISYTHENWAPEGVPGLPPRNMRFEVEWWASDTLGEVFEIALQAPTEEWDELWDMYGKHMMKTDVGTILCWSRNQEVKSDWEPYTHLERAETKKAD